MKLLKKLWKKIKVELAWLISGEVLAAINDPTKTYDEVRAIAEEVADRWSK